MLIVAHADGVYTHIVLYLEAVYLVIFWLSRKVICFLGGRNDLILIEKLNIAIKGFHLHSQNNV